MFDIDAGYAPIIRLDAPTAVSADEEIAAIEKQMEALSLRHCELMEAKRVAFAQAQPIPASGTERKHFKGFEPSVSVEQLTQLMQMGLSITDARMVGSSAVLTADVAKAAQLSSDNDFWSHRHRVLSGTTPMIARSAGHIDRITAAAAGEIEDPAAGLRRERN